MKETEIIQGEKYKGFFFNSTNSQDTLCSQYQFKLSIETSSAAV